MKDVVLDTNILSSFAVAKRGSSIKEIQRLWLVENAFNVILSDYIYIELKRVLDKPYFKQKLEKEKIEQYLKSLKSLAIPVRVTTKVVGAAAHPKDDPIVATAIDGSAKFVVTGDKPFLRRNLYITQKYGVTVIGPEDFIAELKNNKADFQEEAA
jgi:putative PIN family toxin of toxin-antitoxin system